MYLKTEYLTNSRKKEEEKRMTEFFISGKMVPKYYNLTSNASKFPDLWLLEDLEI